MDGLSKAFNEYIEAFKNLETFEKRKALLDSVKEIITIFEELAYSEHIKLEYLKSDEILDINKSNSEDDYLEALLVYIENAKNVIGQYMNNKI